MFHHVDAERALMLDVLPPHGGARPAPVQPLPIGRARLSLTQSTIGGRREGLRSDTGFPDKGKEGSDEAGGDEFVHEAVGRVGNRLIENQWAGFDRDFPRRQRKKARATIPLAISGRVGGFGTAVGAVRLTVSV